MVHFSKNLAVHTPTCVNCWSKRSAVFELRFIEAHIFNLECIKRSLLTFSLQCNICQHAHPNTHRGTDTKFMLLIKMHKDKENHNNTPESVTPQQRPLKPLQSIQTLHCWREHWNWCIIQNQRLAVEILPYSVHTTVNHMSRLFWTPGSIGRSRLGCRFMGATLELLSVEDAL